MDSQGKNEIPPPPKRSPIERRGPKWILKPISIFLTTGDETDTVDRLFVSKHVNDLRLIVATVFVVLLLVLILAFLAGAWTFNVTRPPPGVTSDPKQLLEASTSAAKIFLKLFAPTFAVFGAVLTWAYQVGSARLGVVDLFACEMDTLCRVITIVDMVRNQANKYEFDPSKAPPTLKTKKTIPPTSIRRRNIFRSWQAIHVICKLLKPMWSSTSPPSTPS